MDFDLQMQIKYAVVSAGFTPKLELGVDGHGYVSASAHRIPVSSQLLQTILKEAGIESAIGPDRTVLI